MLLDVLLTPSAATVSLPCMDLSPVSERVFVHVKGMSHFQPVTVTLHK